MTIIPETNFYKAHSPNGLNGTYMLLDTSVTGTVNIIMVAVLANGETTIYNAAHEPYIQQLVREMLNSMGADITGLGSNKIIINGVKKLEGCVHTILPDMIEIGSFIISSYDAIGNYY